MEQTISSDFWRRCENISKRIDVCLKQRSCSRSGFRLQGLFYIRAFTVMLFDSQMIGVGLKPSSEWWSWRSRSCYLIYKRFVVELSAFLRPEAWSLKPETWSLKPEAWSKVTITTRFWMWLQCTFLFFFNNNYVKKYLPVQNIWNKI